MLVGELRVRDRELPLQVGAARRLEPSVGLAVDPRDEEARDREHRSRVTAGSDETLEAPEIGLRHGGIPLQRKDQRHVDRNALGDAVLDRAEPRLGRRNLDVEVRSIDLLVEPDRLLEGALALVGERRVDLERDPTVDTVGPLPDGLHEVAGFPDVVQREREEHLDRVVGRRCDRAQLLVVEVTFCEGLLEDRRVGGDADNGVVPHESGEHSRVEHLAGERVDPDTDPRVAQLGKS